MDLEQMKVSHLLSMQLPPTEALEVFTAELAHDVLRVLATALLVAIFEPRSHGVHLVLREIIPVTAVDIALLAVVVVGVTELVALHLLDCVEGPHAVRVGALHLVWRSEVDNHLTGGRLLWILVDSVESWMGC